MRRDFRDGFAGNDAGGVTYKSVHVDGKEEAINRTAPSAYALGWAPVLLTNVQIDGLGGGGSVNLYIDNLTNYSW